VADAAETRRREAKAAVDAIERQVYRSLSERIEGLLPHGHVLPELSAIKGEMQASKAVSVASKTLEGIAAGFRKATRPALESGDRRDAKEAPGTLALSDELRQKVNTMFYQAEFSHVLVDVSSDLIRLLAAGQWPGVLSHEASMDLGGRLGHSATAIESTLSSVLKCLTEEGALTPEQSNLEAVRTTLQSNVQVLISDLRVDGDKTVVDPDWNPPGLNLLKNASVAKFNCLSVSASLSSILLDADQSSSQVSLIYDTVEQISNQSTAVSQRLSNLDLTDEGLLTKLEAQASEWKNGSSSLLKSAKEALLGAGDWNSCRAHGETTLRALAVLSSSLRAAKMNPNEDGSNHPLSPESSDCWNKLAALATYTQSLDGDEDDVNFRFRSRAVEHRLSSAIEKESKLDVATSRIASLEKVRASVVIRGSGSFGIAYTTMLVYTMQSLASKGKEISMMTARLSELEKLLAKSKNVSTPVGRGPAMDFRSSAEFHALEEENRMVRASALSDCPFLQRCDLFHLPVPFSLLVIRSDGRAESAGG
jgi:dynactin 1